MNEMGRMSGMVALLLLLGTGLFAQQVVQIDDNIAERNFMPNELMYYVDLNNTLTFQDISSADFADNFQTHPGYQNKDFNVAASYWIRIPIQHRTGTRKIWL